MSIHTALVKTEEQKISIEKAKDLSAQEIMEQSQFLLVVLEIKIVEKK